LRRFAESICAAREPSACFEVRERKRNSVHADLATVAVRDGLVSNVIGHLNEEYFRRSHLALPSLPDTFVVVFRPGVMP
jgi:hypothetical protein